MPERIVINAEPLTSDAFKPYGQVIEAQDSSSISANQGITDFKPLFKVSRHCKTAELAGKAPKLATKRPTQHVRVSH